MLKWINTAQLRLGMYVSEMDGAWIENPFWRSKLLLEKKEDLRRMAGEVQRLQR